jgi:membrane peptidoglycan carboxypeptidase
MKQFVQKINNAPFVQKLRAVEQRRMSRLSTRRMQFKESTSKVVTTIDTKAKEAFKQALKEYAEDITYVVDALNEEDETSSE